MKRILVFFYGEKTGLVTDVSRATNIPERFFLCRDLWVMAVDAFQLLGNEN